MKKAICILLVVSGRCLAQTVMYNWHAAAGSVGDESIHGTKMDASGNIYSVGQFSGTVDFDHGPGTTTLTSFGNYDIFITKHNSSGALQWAKQVGSVNDEIGYAITTDATGNVYTTGYYRHGTDFDPSAASYTLAAQAADIFVLKLNTSGNFIWAKGFGGSSLEYGYGISVDASGNVVTTGFFSGTCDFDPDAPVNSLVASGSSNDVFISKLDALGNYVWAKRIGGTGNDQGQSVACHASGNIFVCGLITGTVDLDPGAGTFNHPGIGGEGFVTRLDPTGNFVWGNGIGGNAGDQANGLALDSQGHVVVTGYFSSTVDFDYGAGTNTISVTGGTDAFVVKYASATGSLIWVTPFKSAGTEHGLDVAINSDNEVFVSGHFFGTTNFDVAASNFTLASTGGFDAFAAKLNSNGSFGWALKTGGTAADAGNAIAVNGSDVVYAGYYQGTSDFDHGPATSTATSQGGQDLFLVKLCSQPYPPIINNLPTSLNICANNASTLTTSSTFGIVNWYATSSSTTVLGTGTVFATPTLAVGTHTYYASITSCTESVRTAVTITVTNCTVLIEQVELHNVLLSPNPFSNVLNVDSKVESNFEIIDLSGRSCFNGRLVIGRNQIELSDLKNGIYFLNVKHGGYGSEIYKILKH